jgi:hypothetical protein
MLPIDDPKELRVDYPVAITRRGSSTPEDRQVPMTNATAMAVSGLSSRAEAAHVWSADRDGHLPLHRHLAARMEQMAKPGSALVTGATLAEGYGQVRPLGAVTVKGLETATPVAELKALFEESGGLVEVPPSAGTDPRDPYRHK